jgi:5'-nucleotidase
VNSDGGTDAMVKDTGGGLDTGTNDTGVVDTGTEQDTGIEDTGTNDTGVEDTGVVDTGNPNAIAIQLISISDWHAQLDPLNPTAPSTIAVGGAAALSSYFQQERAANPNTITVTAGDAFGGSPPLSSFFMEMPAVEAMNLMGIDVDTFGNHNFDRGIAALQSLIDLANFTYVSSNLTNVDVELAGVETPYYNIDIGGVRVGFVGITNPDAPTLVGVGNFGTITVDQVASSAMFARQAAIDDGAQVTVALVHLGGAPLGELQAFAEAVSGFDVIFGDHTDEEVNTVINGQRVVENRSKGRTYARVRLSVDPDLGTVTVDSSDIIIPYVNAVVPDPAVVTLLDGYRTQLNAQLDGVIATATDLFPRGGGIERLGEVAIGDLVTDALRDTYGTQLAFLNGGGIRDLLPSSYLPADMTLRRNSPGYAAGPPYDLVTGDAYAVFPFGNTAVTRTITGALLYQALEHSVSAIPAPNGRFLQISGFRFTYTASVAAGSRVLSVELDDGTPILADATTYTLATFDFINNGGDGYTFLGGTGTTRDLDASMLAAYLERQGTITPATEGRITRVYGVPGNCDLVPREPVPGQLVINEILFDPGPDVANGDANGDGVREGSEDEFIELVNASTSTLDLTGVLINDAVNNRHVFASTTLGCGDSIVVFGGGTAAQWTTASGGLLGLNNGGDTVTILDATGTVTLAEVIYAGGDINQSTVRQTEGDANAAFIDHSTHPQAGGRFWSPGTRVDGTPF